MLTLIISHLTPLAIKYVQYFKEVWKAWYLVDTLTDISQQVLTLVFTLTLLKASSLMLNLHIVVFVVVISLNKYFVFLSYKVYMASSYLCRPAWHTLPLIWFIQACFPCSFTVSTMAIKCSIIKAYHDGSHVQAYTWVSLDLTKHIYQEYFHKENKRITRV